MSAVTPPVRSLFTIGHSNAELSDFLSVLIRHEIKVVCDVRSRPGSFRFPQFNREALSTQLASAKIRYEYFGDQLGGRPLDPQYLSARMAWSIMSPGAARPIFWKPWIGCCRYSASRTLP